MSAAWSGATMTDGTPLRILVLSQYFWPENFRINDLVEELAARGHHVTVLTGVPNYPGGKIFTEFATDPDGYSSFRGVEVLRIPMLPGRRSLVQISGGDRIIVSPTARIIIPLAIA